MLTKELDAARLNLFAQARQFLPSYLVFASRRVQESILQQLLAPQIGRLARNKQARADERHLALYLQRVAGKNDSLSEFGPEGWGIIDSTIPALVLHPGAGSAGVKHF